MGSFKFQAHEDGFAVRTIHRLYTIWTTLDYCIWQIRWNNLKCFVEVILSWRTMMEDAHAEYTWRRYKSTNVVEEIHMLALGMANVILIPCCFKWHISSVIISKRGTRNLQPTASRNGWSICQNYFKNSLWPPCLKSARHGCQECSRRRKKDSALYVHERFWTSVTK